MQNSRSGASKIHQKASSESIQTTKTDPREAFLTAFSATSPKNRSKSVRERPKVFGRGHFFAKVKTFCPPEGPKTPKRQKYKPVLVSEREARLRLKSLRALMMISCRDLSRLQQRWRASSYLMLLQSPNIFTWLCPCAAVST